MKKIFKIAKTELKMLFCSPISWFLLIVFILQLSFIFTGLYGEFLHANQWNEGKQFLTSFRFIMRMWASTTGTLYYYIPLLTMGLISRELNSGSIKLLYSSPITNTQIVLGKFLSSITFAIAICAIMSLYLIVAANTIVNFELGAALCGLLGIFLLACTYISIGLFMSSLTSYQFVAAIGTFIILMILSVIGGMWQEYDVVRDITYWLSINGRVFTFITGMLCSEDLIYFPTITAMFLAFTIIRLNSRRQRVSFMTTFGYYFLVVAMICLIAYLSSRPQLMAYYDATNTKQNSLTKQSQEVLAKMDGRLKITGYANAFYNRYNEVSFPGFIHWNRETFKLYERFKPDTKLKMVYYYDSIAPDDRVGAANGFKAMMEKEPTLSFEDHVEKIARRNKINPSIFKSPDYFAKNNINLRGERTMGWMLELNDKKVWLRIYPEDLMSIFPNEEEISAAMKALVTKLHKVAIVKGHGMRTFTDVSPRNYFNVAANKDNRFSLLNQGFNTVDLDISGGVPEDIDILIFADMYEPLSESENLALKDYIDRGGNLFILAEQSRRAVMNPMLEEYFGVKLMDGTLVQYRENWIQPSALVSLATPATKDLSYRFGGVAKSVTMASASGLEKIADRGFNYVPIYMSDTIVNELVVGVRENRSYAVWNEMGSLDTDLGVLTCNTEKGEKCDDYCTVASLSRMVGGKEQRIVISGDADCLSTGEMLQSRGGNNLFFGLAVFHYLSNNEMPFDTRRPDPMNNEVQLETNDYKLIYRMFVIVLPLLFLGASLFIWLRRRSR